MNETQMEAAESQERSSSRLLWPVRLILRLIIKAIVMVFLAIRLILRPRPVRYAVVVLLVLGFAAWQILAQSMSNQGVVQARGQQSSLAASSLTRASTTASEQLAPAPVVEQYLIAQANFDAPGMWAAIGDDLKAQLAASGTTVEDLQGELNAAKDSGRKYGDATYVAGSRLQDGANAYFYVITVDTGSGTMKVPYIYVVGGDGKIASIQ